MTLELGHYDPAPPLTEDLHNRPNGHAGNPVLRVYTRTGIIQTHLEKAESLLESGQYDDAYEEFSKAADRYLFCKEKIEHAMDNAIGTLSTLGSRATAPHPKALSLVRLRREIKA